MTMVLAEQWQRFTMPTGQEIMICSDMPDGTANFIVNWAKDNGDWRGMGGFRRTKTMRDKINKNTEEHLKRLKKGIVELFNLYQGKKFIIAGSGRSLNNIDFEDMNLDDFVIVAINGAITHPKIFPYVDCFFVVDWMGNDGWWKNNTRRDIKLITSVTTPVEILNYFDDYYHFVGTFNYADQKDAINQKYAYLGQLDSGLTATYSCMHFAYKCGTKYVILIGQDFAATDMMYHWDEPLTWERCVEFNYRPYQDINETITLSCEHLERNMLMIKGVSKFFEEAKIEVLNCSGRGILDIQRKDFEEVKSYVSKSDNN